MSKRRKHGKYRDSKHYREYRTKKGNTATVYTGGTTSKTVKSAGSDAYGGYTGGYGTGYLSKWGMCTTRHYQNCIDLGDGLVIFASAWADSPHRITYKDGDGGMVPDVGIYFDDAWAGVATHLTSPGIVIPGITDGRKVVLYHWRDYDVPDSMDEFIALLRWTLAQIEDGAVIETGCFAGHGRTGTFLAGLMILRGMTAGKAIAKTREEQCTKCVETTSQREWLFDLDAAVNGRPSPMKGQTGTTVARNHDEFGRRLPPNDDTMQAWLNEMEEDEAYEQWLRLNTGGYNDDWCDYEDLPNNLCTCPGRFDPEPGVPCYDGPCAMRDVCAGGECFAYAMQTGGMV